MTFSQKLFRSCLGAILLGISQVSLSQSSGSTTATAEFVVMSNWGNHYCGEIQVSSVQTEINDWQVTAVVDGKIRHVWNGSYEVANQSEYNAVFVPAQWNATLPVGGSTTIGVCGSGPQPTNLAVLVGAPTPPVAVLPITELDQGAYASYGAVEQQYLTANTEAELQVIEDLIQHELEVNLEESTVIGVFMGHQPTGGYSIEVTRVLSHTDVIANVTETSPGPGCFVTQATTSPFHVVAIPKTQAEITFNTTSMVMTCTQ